MASKFCCYLVLAVAALIYFQKNPIYTIVIIGLGFGLYFFVKTKKNGGPGGIFLGSRQFEQQESFNTALSFLMLQQLLNDDRKEDSDQDASDRQKEDELDKHKREISELFKKN